MPDEVRGARQLLEQATAKSLGDLILDRLGRCPSFIAAVLPLRVLQPRCNRYEGGGYGSHVDNVIFPVSGTGIRTDVSATLFLSDPSEYQGGELLIEDQYGAPSVKLLAGHLAIYPGNRLHRVEPETSGVRFASFFWTQSLVRSDRQRNIPFDLDTAIQSLAADHAEHSSIERLTSVYHDLLREWSVP